MEAGEVRLLVDAGRGAATRLFEMGGARSLVGVDAVLLTHLHSDHAVGLPDLWLTGWLFGREAALRIVGPPGTRAMCDGLRAAFAFDLAMRGEVDERLPAAGAEFDVREVAPGESLDLADLRITAFAVDHGPIEPAYGFRIDRAGRSVAFSGDTRASDSLVAAARGVDVLIHEVVSPEAERRLAQVPDAARVERIIERHTPPDAAGRIFAQVEPRLAVYTHIVPSPARRRDLVGPTRRTWKGRLVVGEDRMQIEIGAAIHVRR